MPAGSHDVSSRGFRVDSTPVLGLLCTITLSAGGGTTLSVYCAIPDLILNVPSLRGVVIQRLEGISGVYDGERDGGGVGTESKPDSEVGTGARRVRRGCSRVFKEARHGPV